MATVLITGTSRGIGLETALAFARSGHTVYATMRDPDGCPELGQSASREGLPITVSIMDVDSDASVAQAVAAALEVGSIDVLVNNAGIERHGTVEESDLSEFRAVMETNYFGALRCIKAVLPQMRERRTGCIVNVSSVSGRLCSSPLSAYSASKWALEAVSEALAQEVRAFGIRVALVEPGFVDTAMPRTIAQAGGSAYPQVRRMARFFAQSLQAADDAAVVARAIVDIVESGTGQLRHPVGFGAQQSIERRASMSDEAWIDWWGEPDDDVWYAAVERDLGLSLWPNGPR